MVLFGDDSVLHLTAIHLPVWEREKEGPAKSRILKNNFSRMIPSITRQPSILYQSTDTVAA
jgi:hypothetical protein